MDGVQGKTLLAAKHLSRGAVPRPVTERLWITEPLRATALATVTAARGTWFSVDRALFAPKSRIHRHPQPADGGTVWRGGEKRRLESVTVRDGEVWHRLRGAVPDVGERLQCQLDREQRELASRAHTAMHLLLLAMKKDVAALVRDPEVKGGGSFRLDFDQALPPTRLAVVLAQANTWAQQDGKVSREHHARGREGLHLDAQRFQPPDPYPGPADVLDAVRIAGIGCYPCDGTHVASTRKVGRIVLPHVRAARGGFSIVGKVV